MRVLIRSKGDRNLVLYYLEGGREISKSAGTRDRGEAERAAQRWEQELLEFRGSSGDGWPYFRQRFEDEHLATLSSKGQAAYGTAMNHYERVMAPRLITEVTVDSVSTFKAKLLLEKMKVSSISTHLRHLRTAFNWAAEMKLLRAAVKVKIPKSASRKFMRGRPVTEGEYLEMLEACVPVCGAEALAWRRFLELLWYSGMRLEEATRCSWDSPPVMVRLDSKPYPTIMFYAEGHKAGQDTVSPVTPEFHQWLSQTPEAARAGKVAPLPVQAVEASRRISAIGQACRILVDENKHASAHDIRRAFGSRWAKVVRPLTLQKLMRHRDFTTTLKYYIGLEAEDAGAELWSGLSTGLKRPRKRTTANPSALSIAGKKRGSA